MSGVLLTATKPLTATTRRWVPVVSLLAVLVVLAGYGLSPRPADLGIRGEVWGDRVVVTWVGPATWAWDDGVRAGDVVVSIDGAAAGPQNVAQLRHADRLIIETNGGATIVLQDQSATVLRQRVTSLLPLAICFVAVGSTVFVLASDLLPAVVFLVWSLTAAIALLASTAAAYDEPWALALSFLAIIASSVSTVGLFLVFPVNHLSGRGGWSSVVASVLAGLVASASYIGTFVGRVDYSTTQRVAFLVVSANFLVGVGLLGAAIYWSWERKPEQRRQLLLIVLGAVAGIGPFFLFSLGPVLLGFGNLVPPYLSVLSLVLLPISIALALLSRQFLGITRLARRGMIALICWVSLLSVYTVVEIAGLRWLRAHGDPIAAPSIALLSVAAVGASFWPTQRWLRLNLERALFHDIYDYAPTLRRLSDDLAQIQGIGAIADYTLSSLCRTLDLTWASLSLDEPGQHYLHGRRPPGASAALRLPLVVDGAPIGWLSVGQKLHDLELLPDDQTLLTTLSPMLGTALHNAMLIQSLAHQVDVLAERELELSALSNRLLQVQEEERRRLALDLHDDPLQRAILLARKLQQINNLDQIIAAQSLTEEIITSLRAICAGLRPPVLDDFGLVPGLEALVNEVRARSDLLVTIDVETPDDGRFGRLDPDLEVALYRVAQEALNNCLKHAQASAVHLRLRRDRSGVTLSVVDDGPQQSSGPIVTAKPGLRLGLLGMRERLQPWHGAVQFSSDRLNGTEVTARVPLEGLRG